MASMQWCEGGHSVLAIASAEIPPLRRADGETCVDPEHRTLTALRWSDNHAGQATSDESRISGCNFLMATAGHGYFSPNATLAWNTSKAIAAIEVPRPLGSSRRRPRIVPAEESPVFLF